MPVFGNSRPPFIDINGNPIQGGKLYIGMPDQDPVANPSTTVTDMDGNSISATLTLDDLGVTTIPFKVSGDFSQAVFTSTNVEVTSYQQTRTGGFLQESDLIGVSGQGGDWNVAANYSKGNFVKGSNDRYYKSLTNNNLGNDPTSALTSWSRLAWPTLYNANETYDTDDSCMGSDGITYLSTIDSNVGTDPVGDVSGDWTRGANLNGALIYRLAGANIPDAANSIINFDAEVYDTSAFHDLGVNPSRLTVPAGVTKVRLTMNMSWGVNVTGVRRIGLVKNGAIFDGRPRGSIEGVSITPYQNVVSPVLDVTVGDYFELEVLQSSGGVLAVNPGSSNLWFSIEVVQ